MGLTTVILILVMFSSMGTSERLGYNGTTSDFSNYEPTHIRGGNFTSPDSGTAWNITTKTGDYWGSAYLDDVKYGLYYANKSFIANTTTGTQEAGIGTLLTLPFESGGVPIVADQDYLLVAWSKNYCAFYNTPTAGTENTQYDTLAFGAWPDPVVLGTAAEYKTYIYMDYTTATTPVTTTTLLPYVWDVTVNQTVALQGERVHVNLSIYNGSNIAHESIGFMVNGTLSNRTVTYTNDTNNFLLFTDALLGNYSITAWTNTTSGDLNWSNWSADIDEWVFVFTTTTIAPTTTVPTTTTTLSSAGNCIYFGGVYICMI